MKRLVKETIILVASIVSLTSCELFFPKPKITQISIEDFHNAYAIGDTFIDNQELDIVAKWNDGKYTTLDSKSVSYTITCDGKKYSSSEPFSVVGTYSLTVKKDKVTSNKINFTVQNEKVYASSVNITGDNEVRALHSVELNVNVNPTNHTQMIEFTTSNPEVATISRSKNGLLVNGEFFGETDIEVKVKSSEGNYVTTTFHMNILSPIEKTVLEQTYQDYMGHREYYLSSCPVSGSPRLLVIPVWFTDSDSFISSSKKEYVREDIYDAYFGDSDSTGWESVSSFYNKESSGKLSLTGTVASWYNAGTSYLSYATNTGATVALVKAATNNYFSNHPEDPRTNYDLDQDGYLDGVMIIYAAPDYRTMEDSSKSNLWAYCYWVQSRDASVTSPIPNVFFWASYDFMYGSNTVYARTGNNYHGGDTSHSYLDTHTFIHEMGHVFGLDDYYDYSNQYNPAGGFSMQDYNVGGHDPYSVMAMGWADPYIPTESITLRLGEFQKTRELILLTPSFNDYNSPFDEYLLLELYSPTGLNSFDSTYSYLGYYPQGPNQVGIRLWHVDARLTEIKQPMPSSPKYYTSVFKDNVSTAMSNTYYSSSTADRISPLGRSYADYNLLQLIRNNKLETYKPKSTLDESHLFYEGDSFDMKSYILQFKRFEALNSNKKLGWSFNVESISDIKGVKYATITLVKD